MAAWQRVIAPSGAKTQDRRAQRFNSAAQLPFRRSQPQIGDEA
jgi:hypothetical protein